MVKSCGWVGGMCRRLFWNVQAAMLVAHVILVSPQVPKSHFDFWILTSFGFGLRGLDMGLGLVN